MKKIEKFMWVVFCPWRNIKKVQINFHFSLLRQMAFKNSVQECKTILGKTLQPQFSYHQNEFLILLWFFGSSEKNQNNEVVVIILAYVYNNNSICLKVNKTERMSVWMMVNNILKAIRVASWEHSVSNHSVPKESHEYGYVIYGCSDFQLNILPVNLND